MRGPATLSADDDDGSEFVSEFRQQLFGKRDPGQEVQAASASPDPGSPRRQSVATSHAPGRRRRRSVIQSAGEMQKIAMQAADEAMNSLLSGSDASRGNNSAYGGQ